MLANWDPAKPDNEVKYFESQGGEEGVDAVYDFSRHHMMRNWVWTYMDRI